VTELILVRHGETDWNAAGRLQGHTDRPLSDYGREQARRLAKELAGEEFDAIYASDLARARETAEIVAAQRHLPVILDPDLREKDWGNWEGLTSTERLDVELVGESTEEHQRRMLDALGRIAAKHPEGRILVVTHGGSMRRVQTEALGFAMPVVENCGSWACVWVNGSVGPVVTPQPVEPARTTQSSPPPSSGRRSQPGN
jgi:broad specificity phosphatase PhoE